MSGIGQSVQVAEAFNPYVSLFVAVTLVLVVWLHMRLSGIHVKVASEGITAGALGYQVVDDAGNRAGYYPAHEGMAGSMGGNEPPVFSGNAFDETEEDRNATLRAKTADETSAVEGIVGSKARRPRYAYEGMSSGKGLGKLNKAMLGY
jgi:hypothetical protein